MTGHLPSVTIVRRIKAAPAKVWAAITKPELMMQWWGPDAGPASLVTFRLEPFDGGTVLTLTHEHLPDEETRTSHEQGWSGLLDKLPVFLGDSE